MSSSGFGVGDKGSKFGLGLGVVADSIETKSEG